MFRLCYIFILIISYLPYQFVYGEDKVLSDKVLNIGKIYQGLRCGQQRETDPNKLAELQDAYQIQTQLLNSSFSKLNSQNLICKNKIQALQGNAQELSKITQELNALPQSSYWGARAKLTLLQRIQTQLLDTMLRGEDYTAENQNSWLNEYTSCLQNEDVETTSQLKINLKNYLSSLDNLIESFAGVPGYTDLQLVSTQLLDLKIVKSEKVVRDLKKTIGVTAISMGFGYFVVVKVLVSLPKYTKYMKWGLNTLTAGSVLGGGYYGYKKSVDKPKVKMTSDHLKNLIESLNYTHEMSYDSYDFYLQALEDSPDQETGATQREQIFAALQKLHPIVDHYFDVSEICQTELN